MGNANDALISKCQIRIVQHDSPIRNSYQITPTAAVSISHNPPHHAAWGQHHFDFIPLLFARAGEKRCVVNVLRFFWY